MPWTKITRSKYQRNGLRYASDLTDAEWAEIYEHPMRGAELLTTNNRMELQGVIAALTALKKPSRVALHTDSTYVQRGVTEYLERWKAKHWQTANKKAVANQDLWQALDEALQRHQIEFGGPIDGREGALVEANGADDGVRQATQAAHRGEGHAAAGHGCGKPGGTQHDRPQV